MILYDSGFFAELNATRMACITGSLGSGKTLIAHEIAKPYLDKGYKFGGNISSAWLDRIEDIIPDNQGALKTFFVLDEAGMYVKSVGSATALAGFARKLDIYLLFCGRKLPHRDLTELRMYLWFDCWKNFYIPLWVWRWDVDVQGTKKYHGFVFQTGRGAYYGLYSTLDPADHPLTILKAIEAGTRNLFEIHGHKYEILDLASYNPKNRRNALADFAADVNAAASELRDAGSLRK